MATVLLVRHGRTTANASGTLAGWLPGVELDEVGREAARAVGARLATAGMPVARLVSSPLPRCLQTARLLADALDDRPVLETTDDLGECRYGAWSGRLLSELATEPLWRVVQDHPSAARFPDGELPGESIAEMAARAVAAVRRVDAEVEAAHGAQAVWVAVSHGDVIKAVLADAAGAHLDQFQRFVVDPASVSIVRYTPTRAFLLRSNDLGGPLDAIRPRPESGGQDGGSPSGVASGDAAVGGGAG